MFDIINCYTKLKNNEHLDLKDCNSLLEKNIQPFQYASLVVLLLYSKPNNIELNLIKIIFSRYKKIRDFAFVCFGDELKEYKITSHQLPEDAFYTSVIEKTKKNIQIGEEQFRIIINKFTNKEICLEFMSTWLMLVYCYGLSEQDVYSLTRVMCESGHVYDYRNNVKLNHAKMVRRYPTGALSEKAALILPSLLATVSHQYNIKSPFLIAKSLSFTGGTWDKLRSIPSFHFPSPGDDAVRVMNECSVAMTVTKDDVNPADRMLYEFRSITGTVESLPLLASSIATKQLSLPVDYLLLDVRYGPGSFCKTQEISQKLANMICKILNKAEIRTEAVFCNTLYPNGISVGNVPEICEAIAVMKPKSEKTWNISLINQQRDMVVTFFSNIMAAMFPDNDELFWRSIAYSNFSSGKVLSAFKQLLKAHNVSENVIQDLCENSMGTLLNQGKKIFSIDSQKSGVLVGLDQKKLGNLVNFQLGTATINNGIVLNKMLNERVNYNDKLCDVLIDAQAHQDKETLHALVQSCFIIE